MKTFAELNFPGRLIAVEGLDGSGKSTQIYLLKRWLEAEGIKVYFSEWNSSELVKSATSKGKKRELLTPTTFSLIHATDFADRYERHLLPLLRAGYIVLCDRYVFTAFARDVTRGCPPEWVRGIYSFAALPDLTFFFKADLEVSLNRILEGRPKLKFFEAGMDLRLSTDPYESFRIFQGRILEQYMAMSKEFNFVVMDANQNVEKQQALRAQTGRRTDRPGTKFKRRSPLPLPPPMQPDQQGQGNRGGPGRMKEAVNPAAGEQITAVFTATAFPRVNLEDLAGKLIVVEGADGSGRSTQIARLVDWLETSGHATVQVGLKRSTLVSSELEKAQEGNILSRTTLSLFYATDFADQLENIILPALKAGFIVLADRYIYTLMARDMVRGMDEAWLKNLYGIALEPDAVFYLSVGAGGTGAAQPFQKRDAGLLGKRHGPRPVARHVRQLPEIPDGDAGRVPPIAKNLRLHHRGRQPLRGFHHQGIAQKNPRAARGKIENINGSAAERLGVLIGGNVAGAFVDAGGLRGRKLFHQIFKLFLLFRRQFGRGCAAAHPA